MEIVVPDEYQYLYRQTPDWPVVKIPAPVLRATASPVVKVNKKTQELIDELIRVMKIANGIGLAAPQVGVSQRVIIVAPPGLKPLPLVNPKVLSVDGVQVGQEGCLSIPGLYGDVERALRVEVEALDRRGRPAVFELEEIAARVALHEIDHLDGVLFIDKADPATLHWEHPAGASEPAE
jgi:peptide deformylase